MVEFLWFLSLEYDMWVLTGAWAAIRKNIVYYFKAYSLNKTNLQHQSLKRKIIIMVFKLCYKPTKYFNQIYHCLLVVIAREKSGNQICK